MHPSRSSHWFFHNQLKCRLFFFALMIPSCHLTVPDFVSCSGDRNFTLFESNRDIVLASLAESTPATGFSTTAFGVDPAQVFGLALCRGDISSDECRACVSNATRDSPGLCPGSVAVRIWYTYCFLRYTDWTFFGLIDHYERYACATINAVDSDLFNRQMNSLMTSLLAAAAVNDLMFATGDIEYTTSDRIYGLVQCTRDLSSTDCNTCLMQLIHRIPYFCNGTQGARLSYGTCVVWYETYRFFTVTDPRPLPPPPPPSQPLSPPPSSQPATTIVVARNRTLIMVLAAATSALVVINLASCFCLFTKRRRKQEAGKQENPRGNENQMSSMATEVQEDPEEFRVFNFDKIGVATNKFFDGNKLGEGVYGPVYKANLDGEDVAVKRLPSSGSRQGAERFMNDVKMLAEIQHKNLVRLLGCSAERNERLLVYEYMPNSSLNKFLFDPTRSRLLDWPKRLRIITGVAEGLRYLHESSQLSIIHKDLKASNVLLDMDMNPQITDIDLARHFEEDQIYETMMSYREKGCIAPEYLLQSSYSTKSDVFSFGVLVLEILSGQKNIPGINNLHEYAWRYWNKGRELELMDAVICNSCNRPEFSRCFQIGLLCVQDEVQKRPTMSNIILMLNSTSLELPSPELSTMFVRHEWAERNYE